MSCSGWNTSEQQTSANLPYRTYTVVFGTDFMLAYVFGPELTNQGQSWLPL